LVDAVLGFQAAGIAGLQGWTTGWGGLRTLLLAMMLKTMLKTLPIFHQKDF